jgi:hypothetical protein
MNYVLLRFVVLKFMEKIVSPEQVLCIYITDYRIFCVSQILSDDRYVDLSVVLALTLLGHEIFY